MSYLLDTHTLLWAIWNDIRLSENAKSRITDPDSQVYVSLASVWEIAIKVGLGKLTLAQPVEEFIPSQLTSAGFDLLHPTLNDVLYVANLPQHHRDPFDRLLISQSIMQGMPLISADSHFDQYGVERIW